MGLRANHNENSAILLVDALGLWNMSGTDRIGDYRLSGLAKRDLWSLATVLPSSDQPLSLIDQILARTPNCY